MQRRRSADEQPKPDPDAQAKVSDPLWAAVAEDRRQEHLRQGRLLGSSWVSEEESLRPFAGDASDESRELSSRTAVDGKEPDAADQQDGAMDSGAFGYASNVSARSQATSRRGGSASSSRSSVAVAEQESLGASPRWSLLRSQSDLDVGSARGSSREEPEPEPEGPLQVPAGNGLVLWSDEDLRNFAAKRDVRFDGDRSDLEAVVTEELRKDLEKNIKDAHKKPIGMSVTSPLPSFVFATDTNLTAAMGQAREPRHLSTDTKEVLQMLRQAMSHKRTTMRLQLSDLKEAFTSMDTDNSGSLTADELKAGFQRLDLTLTDEACGILFDLLDTDHSGLLSYAELLRAMKTGIPHSHDRSGAKPVALPLKAIEIGKFRAVKGSGGTCSASLTFGSPTAPGGKLGGASLTWVMSRNDAYRNRGRIVLPLSDVIGLDVDGATLTVEVGRPPLVSVGHVFQDTVHWESAASTVTADKLTRGEAHRSRFHILRATSAFELNEWKQVLIQASHDHEMMLNAGLAFASSGGKQHSFGSVRASHSEEMERVNRFASAHRTDDGRFNSIHRKEFSLLQGSADAAYAHHTDGRSIVRKRPASASPTVGRSGSSSNMSRGGAMPGRYQSGSVDDSGAAGGGSLTGSPSANGSNSSRDRRGRLRHRSSRSAQSLGNSAWVAAHGGNGRSRAFARNAQESQRGEELPGQWTAAASKQSLLGHRPRVGTAATVKGDDGYGYSGAAASHHSADAAGGIIVVRSPASHITPMAEERTRGWNARRSRDGSAAASLSSASSQSLTTRSAKSPSLYAENQLISDALLRRLRVNHTVVEAY